MPKKPASSPQISDDAMRLRAYLLWEADGRPDGRADHYWDLASADLTRAAAQADAPVKKGKAKPGKSGGKKGPTAKGRKKRG